MASITRSELVIGIVAAALGAIAVAVPSYLGTNREMDVKMVEIAVGILSQEPKENIAPAREWAVDVISHYAGPVKPSEAVRAALVNYQVVWAIEGLKEQIEDQRDLLRRIRESLEAASDSLSAAKPAESFGVPLPEPN